MSFDGYGAAEAEHDNVCSRYFVPHSCDTGIFHSRDIFMIGNIIKYQLFINHVLRVNM